jgi:hypothetical protein
MLALFLAAAVTDTPVLHRVETHDAWQSRPSITCVGEPVKFYPIRPGLLKKAVKRVGGDLAAELHKSEIWAFAASPPLPLGYKAYLVRAFGTDGKQHVPPTVSACDGDLFVTGFGRADDKPVRHPVVVYLRDEPGTVVTEYLSY